MTPPRSAITSAIAATGARSSWSALRTGNSESYSGSPLR